VQALERVGRIDMVQAPTAPLHKRRLEEKLAIHRPDYGSASNASFSQTRA